MQQNGENCCGPSTAILVLAGVQSMGDNSGITKSARKEDRNGCKNGMP
jgi:hypothetical protein